VELEPPLTRASLLPATLLARPVHEVLDGRLTEIY